MDQQYRKRRSKNNVVFSN